MHVVKLVKQASDQMHETTAAFRFSSLFTTIVQLEIWKIRVYRCKEQSGVFTSIVIQ